MRLVLETVMLLNYKQTGQGPHVILIHGLFGSLENLNVIANALAENFTVTNLDLRNHGRSPHSDIMDYPAMADDVLALMDHLSIDKAHLVGHSMGGKVAMQIAHINPSSVNKLVVLDMAPVAYQSRHDDIISALKLVKSNAINDRKEADKLMNKLIPEIGVRQVLLKIYQKNKIGERQVHFNLTNLKQNKSKT